MWSSVLFDTLRGRGSAWHYVSVVTQLIYLDMEYTLMIIMTDQDEEYVQENMVCFITLTATYVIRVSISINNQARQNVLFIIAKLPLCCTFVIYF